MNKLISSIRKGATWLVFLTFAAVCAGCAGKETAQSPLPPELVNEASIPGVPEVRFWGDKWPKFSLKKLETYSDDDFRRYYPETYNKPHNYLAISGGALTGHSELVFSSAGPRPAPGRISRW